MSAMKVINNRTPHPIKVILSSNDIRLTPHDEEMDARAKQAVTTAVEKAKFCKKPVARYDVKTKKAYIEYPDGSRVDVG